MARTTPLHPTHQEGEGLFAPYGPPKAGVELVEAFDPVEVEYAAIRTHAAILDLPSRGLLIARGSERSAFLNRMLTQELKGMEPWTLRPSFWLNRKGRIDSDLRVIELGKQSNSSTSSPIDGESTILEMDVHAVARTLEGLSKYIITEDVSLEDHTDRFHRLSLHGPAACALLAKLSTPGEPFSIAELALHRACTVSVTTPAGPVPVFVFRDDATAEIGLELIILTDHAAAVYSALSTPWSARTTRDSAAPTTDLARRIGWHAYNIARIEAGTPLYNLDFGPDSLPHETGAETLADRVSFKKGCYLGQEVVARMQSLGHPKQQLVGLKVLAPSGEAQAVSGSSVVAADTPDAPVVGAVTASAISPMLGARPVCFAMMKWSHAQPGTPVWMRTDGAGGSAPGRIAAEVAPNLRLWTR